MKNNFPLMLMIISIVAIIAIVLMTTSISKDASSYASKDSSGQAALVTTTKNQAPKNPTEIKYVDNSKKFEISMLSSDNKIKKITVPNSKNIFAIHNMKSDYIVNDKGDNIYKSENIKMVLSRKIAMEQNCNNNEVKVILNTRKYGKDDLLYKNFLILLSSTDGHDELSYFIYENNTDKTICIPFDGLKTKLLIYYTALTWDGPKNDYKSIITESFVKDIRGNDSIRINESLALKYSSNLKTIGQTKGLDKRLAIMQYTFFGRSDNINDLWSTMGFYDSRDIDTRSLDHTEVYVLNNGGYQKLFISETYSKYGVAAGDSDYLTAQTTFQSPYPSNLNVYYDPTKFATGTVGVGRGLSDEINNIKLPTYFMFNNMYDYHDIPAYGAWGIMPYYPGYTERTKNIHYFDEKSRLDIEIHKEDMRVERSAIISQQFLFGRLFNIELPDLKNLTFFQPPLTPAVEIGYADYLYTYLEGADTITPTFNWGIGIIGIYDFLNLTNNSVVIPNGNVYNSKKTIYINCDYTETNNPPIYNCDNGNYSMRWDATRIIRDYGQSKILNGHYCWNSPIRQWSMC